MGEKKWRSCRSPITGGTGTGDLAEREMVEKIGVEVMVAKAEGGMMVLVENVVGPQGWFWTKNIFGIWSNLRGQKMLGAHIFTTHVAGVSGEAAEAVERVLESKVMGATEEKMNTLISGDEVEKFGGEISGLCRG